MSEQNKTSEVSKEALDTLVKHHMIAAFGAGLVPLPMVDFIAISGVQLNLVRKLSEAYGVPFSRNAVKSIISSLAGGAVPSLVGRSVAGLIRLVPIVGFPIGAVSIPAAAAAMTYAVGNVFIRHFESDGTLLSFDIDSARESFSEMFAKGEEIAMGLEVEVPPSTKPDTTAPAKTPTATASKRVAAAEPKKATPAKKKAKVTKKAAKVAKKTTKAPKKTAKVAKKTAKVAKKTTKAPKKAARPPKKTGQAEKKRAR